VGHAANKMEPTFQMPSRAIADRVQRIVDLVSAGLAQSPNITAWPATPDAGRLGFQVASSANMTIAEVQQTWRGWILANGFRDISELLGESLEIAHTILARASALRANRRQTKLTDDSDAAAASRFHSSGFPTKLDFLSTEFGFSIPSNFRVYGLSINAVRNCLVHRNGLVQGRDLKGAEALVLHWQPLKIIVVGKDGEREIKLGQIVGKGEKVGLVNRRQNKKFAINARIELTPDEFSEVAWTVSRFAAVVDSAIEAYAEQNGMSIVPGEIASYESADAT
jgi:hypothetical protein